MLLSKDLHGETRPRLRYAKRSGEVRIELKPSGTSKLSPVVEPLSERPGVLSAPFVLLWLLVVLPWRSGDALLLQPSASQILPYSCMWKCYLYAENMTLVKQLTTSSFHSSEHRYF